MSEGQSVYLTVKVSDKVKLNTENARIETLCAMLRMTAKEFGKLPQGAFIVGSMKIDHVSDIPYCRVANLAFEKLGGVPYKVAEFFENSEAWV